MNFENHVTECGSGPPIVFVHGSYAGPAAWKAIAKRLAPRHRCIAIALPGHAGCPRPDDFAHPSLAPEFEILDWVLRERCEDPAHLVGHSFGGGVALAYALRNPQALRALTLFEPVAVWILRSCGEQQAAGAVDRIRRALRRDLEAGIPHACGQVIDFWGGLGSFDALPERVKDTMAGLERDNLRHWDLFRNLEAEDDVLAYGGLDCPVGIVHGERSNPVAGRIVQALRGRLPASQSVEIPGASHFLVTTHAAVCAAQVATVEKRAEAAPEPTSWRASA